MKRCTAKDCPAFNREGAAGSFCPACGGQLGMVGSQPAAPAVARPASAGIDVTVRADPAPPAPAPARPAPPPELPAAGGGLSSAEILARLDELLGAEDPAEAGPGTLPPPAVAAAPAAPVAVECAICGGRSREEETFECRECGRDHLCLEHFVMASHCCGECAAKLAETERAAREEAAGIRAEQARRAEAQRAEAALAERVRQEAERAGREGRPPEGERRREAAGSRRWANSLGMEFVPVPGTQVMFCIWETRVQDYAAYAQGNPGVHEAWQHPGFAQGPAHPVVKVSWKDAQGFCQWLTRQEQAAGRITPQHRYRLPTDEEWSRAAGLASEEGATPRARAGKARDHYPWGSPWPPPLAAGNYARGLGVDSWEHTSPVGCFAPNAHGLHDLGGNVWEWCEDEIDNGQKAELKTTVIALVIARAGYMVLERFGITSGWILWGWVGLCVVGWLGLILKFQTLRGASWKDDGPSRLLTACRDYSDAAQREPHIGFRVVLDGAERPAGRV